MTAVDLPLPSPQAGPPPWPRRRRSVPDVPGRRDILALASLVLDYPGDQLLAMRAELRQAAQSLPPSGPADRLARFTDWFAGLDPSRAQSTYVETFDLRRRSSLYLTYYLHGDTRRRGQALILVKQRYRVAGFAVGEEELADYLPTALEFAALAGPDSGEAILRSHRVGLELILRSLKDGDSPYADVLAAVCEVVGDLGEAGTDEVAELMRSGPPGELVGSDIDLDPYAMPPIGSVAECHPPHTAPKET